MNKMKKDVYRKKNKDRLIIKQKINNMIKLAKKKTTIL